MLQKKCVKRVLITSEKCVKLILKSAEKCVKASIYLISKAFFKRCQILMAPFLNEMKASTALIKHHADQIYRSE